MLSPSVVDQAIDPPSVVAMGGVCEFVELLCLRFERYGIVPLFACSKVVGLGWSLLGVGVLL